MGRDPLSGRLHLVLGRQNLCFSTIIVIYGSPNCAFLYFVGRQQPTVENHWFKEREEQRSGDKIIIYEKLEHAIISGTPGTRRSLIFCNLKSQFT